MDRGWHGLKFSGASGHTIMNAGLVVMTMMVMMMVIKTKKVILSLNPKRQPKLKPKIKPKRKIKMETPMEH